MTPLLPALHSATLPAPITATLAAPSLALDFSNALVIDGTFVARYGAWFFYGACALGLFVVACLVFFAFARAAARAREEQARAHMAAQIAHLASDNAALQGQISGFGQHMAHVQESFARLLSERLVQVGSQLEGRLSQNGKETGETLGKLHERLAIIDAAQGRLTALSQDMLGLKDILSNKQARGAFGQGRMEAIVSDHLPPSAFAFQHTLSTGARPDCVIFLPHGAGALVIDAKFPLEAFQLLAAAREEEAVRVARARVRSDMGKHIKDVAERYIISGQTQDIALLFVPAESLYADIHTHFEDVVQRAERARVLIVSPSLLMLAVHLVRTMVRDQRMQEEAQRIQKHVGLMMEDVARLKNRVQKLDMHFHQADDDMTSILTSLEKIERQGAKIAAVAFEEAPAMNLEQRHG